MSRIDYDKFLESIPINEVAKRLGMELRAETSTKAKALCPFHDDQTPSLLIDSSREHGRQHFHCFACGAHGDAIDLVKSRLNVGFMEAVEWLASGFSVAAARKKSKARRDSSASGPESSSGLELALQMYQRGSNSELLEAWITERNLEPETVRRAGFAHAASNFLSSCLDAERDISQKRERGGLLEDAHLVRRLFPGVRSAMHFPLNAGDASSTKYGDFFIGERIVFPLYNDQKQLVGLGARAVGNPAGSTSPKYQFTRGFAKARVLYRAEQAFERLRHGARQGRKEQQLFLCEGFLDALRLESIGLDAVAIMGSSLSDQQIQLIKVLCDSLPGQASTVTVVVCFDRDEAGLRGAAHACLKLLEIGLDCKFCWPTDAQLSEAGVTAEHAKDPNDYLAALSADMASELLRRSIYDAPLAVLAFSFGTTADDSLNDSTWSAAPRSRRLRAFTRASGQLRRVAEKDAAALIQIDRPAEGSRHSVQALRDWAAYLAEVKVEAHGSLSEEFLNDGRARLNHARLLAYMGSKRGELPCDEPRWERLDIAATAFNALLVERLGSRHAEPLGSYDAVWVPRSFGGAEPRLKMMPRPEDLTIQQYLLNEILTERWDHSSYSDSTFSRSIPAVRYYREERRTVTTGFDIDGKGNWGELSARTLSFAYQIDMDVVEGRQPASSQGMYRPFHECWLDFMKSVSQQVSEIGYVYTVRLDVKRYYDRLRRYVVRDSLQARLRRAIESVTGDTPGFAELLGMHTTSPSAAEKATAVLERLDEQLFGVAYRRPDTGVEEESDPSRGIPQGPVLSAWIGSIALFPLDQEANRFIEKFNTEKTRVGYARYVDDIVLLADSPTVLSEMREAIDRHARVLELTLLAKADEIPAMSAEEFSVYINQGRALAASGPAWEPPLIGDGESGWEFWSVAPSTDRQSALQLLHNVELYKASVATIVQTVKTALQAPDIRTSELPKAARLLWYAIACEQEVGGRRETTASAWVRYLTLWNECVQGASWHLLPEKYPWESPLLFGLEGIEHLLDTKTRDVQELTAEENVTRRNRITWLAALVLEPGFSTPFDEPISGPEYQRDARFRLLAWKARRATGQTPSLATRTEAERARLVEVWRPFDWMHEAVALLSAPACAGEDPLKPFVEPFANVKAGETSDNLATRLFQSLLPDREDLDLCRDGGSGPRDQLETTAAAIALQTLASVVPRSEVLSCLSRRHLLLEPITSSDSGSRLLLPPLPGIRAERLFSCLIEGESNGSSAVARVLEVIELKDTDLGFPEFVGADPQAALRPLALNWNQEEIESTGGLVRRLKGTLVSPDSLRLRTSTNSLGQPFATGSLRLAADLYRAIATVVRHFAREHTELELVPAWPYIAQSLNGRDCYVIGEGISRAELGNRAFVRDGGRALRTIEIPIYEADLWRVGVAVSDFLGLHDDVAKFSGAETEVTLDAAALGNPARYVLRSQMRKLRGAFADSRIGSRQSSPNALPSSIERSLRLLEEFPDDPTPPGRQLAHVLAIEAESAAMFLSFREQWSGINSLAFLKELTGRLIARLPLSVSKDLAVDAANMDGLRRDLSGVMGFAKQLHSLGTNESLFQEPPWRALCAGTVCAGISVALEGIIASMRSHVGFAALDAFDFPVEWNVAHSASSDSSSDMNNLESVENVKRQRGRVGLVDQMRTLVQHLGHRLRRESNSKDRLSDGLYGLVESVVRGVAQAEYSYQQCDEMLDWPFECLCNQALDLLNLELLESTATLVRQLDAELGFELVQAHEASYGYNAQARRFVDSRNGSWEVTPWMITQFPRIAKHVEETVVDGQVLKVWSEIYDRSSGRLLSVSALGEPFASIALKKEDVKPRASSDTLKSENDQVALQAQWPAEQELALEGREDQPLDLQSHSEAAPEAGDSVPVVGPAILHAPRGESAAAENATNADAILLPPVLNPAPVGARQAPVAFDSRTFRNNQRLNWETRSGSSKRDAHLRVALLQMSLNITYAHPMMEVCPTHWPFCPEVRSSLLEKLEPRHLYEMLARATASQGSEHHWNGATADPIEMPSWAEHRRRRVLERVIDSCEAFKVDLLVLPEYSVRYETVKWLKGYLAGKRVAVLAGTYMEYQQSPQAHNLAARLTLLWPVPKEIANQMVGAANGITNERKGSTDPLARGLVLEFSRSKKYRSIALNELFRPSIDPLGPLFKPEDLSRQIQDQTGWVPTAQAVSTLLSQTRLPLKHILELVCSEVFLVSSPANYLHMAEDYLHVRRRFGESGDAGEVKKDIEELAKHLSITGDGRRTRRSVLAIPAATSRSADYWIAGQACQLAAGTTSVFANGIGGDLVGGSCFIGRGSWKSAHSEPGYVSSLTPYHGWSKGIYYNDRGDALSGRDQAMVIADIDPYNMLEGKPRPQTMPVPLQLVSYLPIVEHVDWQETESTVLRSAQLTEITGSHGVRPKYLARNQADFWSCVESAITEPNRERFESLWEHFPDTQAVSSRAAAFWHNGAIQPAAGAQFSNALGSPALYDWIDVSLSLTGNDALAKVCVPPWLKIRLQ
ncbi:CHC2 zinc finger domain-containing protein [Achromobacter xylosoxidans]|uniref:CHC2 zinc finger domain-containing protein n=1 Tax=Alcaligenes xylosoxydans xylosoxydans TaxID=85698 RepID=UPI0029310869|nr:CHC2 zinc finger domain-containing protein [Achromobacter xylosoxidans]WOB74639.1 CHC2 zinc finger domain-containing protein [Achromobacter xylosoxidans]